MVRITQLLALLFAGLAAGGALASPALLAAAEEGDGAAALVRLAHGADARATSADGSTALHWAVYHDDLALVERLIAAGADVSARNHYGATPLGEAAVVGNARVIRQLLKAGARVDAANAEGQTALMVVARSANVEAARELLRHGADVNAAEHWHGQTPLMWASAQGQPAMMKVLIQAGADVNARSRVNRWPRQVSAERRAQWRPVGGMTPLLYAARQGCLPCAGVLLDAGADINLQNPEAVTALLLAVLNFNFDVAAELVKRGADVDRWDWRGRSPLYAAVDLNTLPTGGRPDRPTADETTGLQVIGMLLAAGANPDLQLKMAPPHRHLPEDRGADTLLGIGATPLLRAAKAHDVEAIGLLLRHGANVELPTATGVTPLMAAAGVSSTTRDTRGSYLGPHVQVRVAQSLNLLIDAGAQVDARSSLGYTALHGATSWGWDQAVALLLERGADPAIRDAQGFTARDVVEGRAGTDRLRGGVDAIDKETATRILAMLADGRPAAVRPGS